MKRARLVPLALIGVAAVVWALFTGTSPAPAERFARAEAMLAERFATWRGRVERAAARLAELAAAEDVDERDRFEKAATILAEERVDGVAVLDWSNRARFWAGRSFQAVPEDVVFMVRRGVEVTNVLAHPAHHVLFAARPAGDGVAVAFLAFDERFPRRNALADEVERATGLAAVRLHYGYRVVPVAKPGEHVFVIDGLVHVTLAAPDEAAREEQGAAARAVRLATLAFLAACAAAFGLWHVLGRRLPRGALLRALLAVTLLVGLRGLLAALGLPALPYFDVASRWWSGAGDTALTALVVLLGAIVLVRAARDGPRSVGAAVFAGAACLLAPRGYAYLVALAVARPDGVVLFDPLKVMPGAPAAVVLGALALLSGALFLLVHAAVLWMRRVHRLLAPAPYVLVAAGLFGWQGLWLAGACALAGLSLDRATTRPEKAAALTFLAALAAFPLLFTAQRAEFERDVAARARDLVQGSRRSVADFELRRAIAAATDEDENVHRQVAHLLAQGHDVANVAFRLWAAARWNPSEPCAVQVFLPDGTLVSAFDFDSPPARWLPAPPAETVPGPLILPGRGEGEAITFYARDFELRTIGDERLVGRARFAVPDRWDMLLSPLRPSIFSEPLDLLVRSGPPPLVLAEFRPDGVPRESSGGTTAEIEPLPAHLRAAARKHGHASERVEFRERPARLVVLRRGYSFIGLIFDDALLEQGGFIFAKMLLVHAGVALLYALGLLLAQRGRVNLLFRHRVGLVLALLSVPPVYLLAAHNSRVAEKQHEAAIHERLERRLDLAAALLREHGGDVDNRWCADVAASHQVDINVYRGQDLVATSRPGVWDTGLLGRRLAAGAFVALDVDKRRDYVGREFFGPDWGLRAAYRRIDAAPGDEPFILAAPALEDRRALERRETESNAVLLAIYLLTATTTVFVALLLGRSLTTPVRRLQEATTRIAGGELDAKLPEGRQDEFGALIRAFNRMTRELRDAQDLRVRAEKAAAWREMASQVAHEIKNPLTPIKLTVQNLLAADPESFREDFERGAQLILDQIDALHRIAGAFSAYARFPSQDLADVDVAGLLREVADLYGADEAEIEVATTGGPLVVRADRDELRRVLINLVTNSQQAQAKSIELRAAAEGDFVRVDVIDDGTGIPDDVRARIFDPAFTTKTSGTGLGMPIVKRTVDDYGGTIELESEPGAGTRVTVRLPAR